MAMKLKKGQKLVEFLYNKKEGSAVVTYWLNQSYKDPSYVKNVSIEEANKRFDELVREGFKNAI